MHMCCGADSRGDEADKGAHLNSCFIDGRIDSEDAEVVQVVYRCGGVC